MRRRSIFIGGFLVGLLGLAPHPAHAGPRAAADTSDSPSPGSSGRTLLISGAAIAGTGLLCAATGFGTIGGMHAANPGPGLSFVAEDPAQARRMLSLARGMEGLAWTGVGLVATGTILAVVGGARLRRARDARVGFAAGPRSVAVSLRF